MAEAIFGRRTFVLPSSRVEVREWVIAHREVLALAGIMAVAFALRFWDLGSRALHHDESLHAQFSFYLYDGGTYKHDPLMHGPFQFHITAVFYFLFGASDYTARIAPALFGVALVGMPYLLKKQIGIKAVLIAAVLLCFSPTLLYYSRFERNEAWMAVWTLGMVICVWRYLDEQRNGWLYGLAALLALSFASKEVTFITVAIMLAFVNLMLAAELGRRREDEEVRADLPFRELVAGAAAGPLTILLVLNWLGTVNPDTKILLSCALGGFGAAWLLSAFHWYWTRSAKQPPDHYLRVVTLAPFAWALAALWPLISQRPFGRERLPPIGDVLIILGTFSLPQFAPGIQVLPFVGNDGYEALSNPAGPLDPESNLRLTSVVVLIIMCAYVGLLWKPKVWAIAAGFFYIPFVLLYTTFFTNQPPPWSSAFRDGRGGFFSGTWGSLDYWLDQHHVQRGNQPKYYYALMTPLYEFLPMLLALGGGLWMAMKGDSFKRWLLFWLAGIFVGLSVAGEKMPWLEVHIALPLSLIAAVVLAKVIDELEFSFDDWKALAGLAALSSVALVLILQPNWAPLGLDLSSNGRFAGYVLMGAAILWLGAMIGQGGKGGLRAVSTVAVALLLTLTIRAGTMVSFNHGDIPVEMMVYTQTSPDIPDLRDRIDTLAKESGLGLNLPIVVDSTDGFSWPWAWYLRDYHDVQYPSITQGYQPPENAVLLIAQGNSAFVDTSGYSTTPYKHRWWFIEESYRDLTPSKLWDTVRSPAKLENIADFWLFRRSETFTGSVNAVAFFPNTLSGFDTDSPAVKPAPDPQVLPDGRITIGGLGIGPGLFTSPADVAVADSGEIFVADSRNNRIQKFDSQGRWLASVGGGGTSPGRFNEPWSVAVDSAGFVYVADTWNHRIQKLDADLKVVNVWGEPYYGANPGPFQMFGPRDIAVGPDGTLWVTDTGNKRIVNYSTDGRFIQSIGSPGNQLGQLDEAVSIDFDAAGSLWVADNWNERLQRFFPGFTNQTAHAAGWTSKEAIHKPYVAVLADGRVVTTDPAKGVVLLFDFKGPARAWRPNDGGRPIGLAALADGGFVVSDAARNEVQIVPGSQIERLFK